MKKLIAIGAFAFVGSGLFAIYSFSSSDEEKDTTSAKGPSACYRINITCPDGSAGYSCDWKLIAVGGSNPLCNNGPQIDCAPILICR